MSAAKIIAQKLQSGVLVLGPEVVINKDGKSIQSGYAERYVHNNKGLVRHYFTNDNLIKPKSPTALITIQKDFADFYKHEFQRSAVTLYRKLSQIPYPLIISLNPDDTMIGCFNELQIQFSFDAYARGKKDKKNDPPDSTKPYLFNLLGSYTDSESLIITFDDLLEYLRNILPGDGLPTSIRQFLQKATNITFLGVEFDKWYFQLLVKLLTESDEKYDLLRYAAPDMSSKENIKRVCENNFEITFVGPHVVNFIDELYYHCSRQEENPLRGKPILSEGKVFNPEIFISYKHTGESKKLADELFEVGRNNHYNMIYDKENLEFRGNLAEFMKRLGWGKYIIVVVSKEYMKSESCMFEFKEIMDKGEKFEEKIFPIVMADPDFFKESNWKNYEEFWTGEIDKLKTDLKDLDSRRLFQRTKSIEKYEDIRNSISKMMGFLTSILTYQVGDHESFNPLFLAIKEQIKIDFDIF